MDYIELKQLAKSMKCRVTELLALSANNDPFYCGMPAQIDKARWFAELWQRFGYTSGVHLRRMHYQIVSQKPPVLMVNGLPYENTEKCWDELGKASQAARYLDMVDPENFVDRRNGAPIDNIDYVTTHHADIDVKSNIPDFWDMELPEFPELPEYSLSLDSPQRYHLELWCEKSTQDDILRPLSMLYNAALQYGLGELSVTLAVEAMRRFEKSGKPVRIFYISDFDPAGWNMPRSMSAKLQYFNIKMGLNLDIKLFPVILTPEQCREYNLPRTPIKDGDRRKSGFELRFGVGATELDALEALYPGELRRVLREELDRYYDGKLSERVWKHEQDVQQALTEAQDQIYDRYKAEIEELESEWQAIREEFEGRISEHSEKRDRIWQAIQEELGEVDHGVSEDDVPEAYYADEREGALFDSSRDYLTQNAIYQAHKGNDTEEELSA